jgi:hypothetical protein
VKWASTHFALERSSCQQYGYPHSLRRPAAQRTSFIERSMTHFSKIAIRRFPPVQAIRAQAFHQYARDTPDEWIDRLELDLVCRELVFDIGIVFPARPPPLIPASRAASAWPPIPAPYFIESYM